MATELSEFRELEISDLIAPFPLEKRDNSRLMIINRKDKTIKHSFFYDIINYLNPGDCIILNETMVVKNKIYLTDEMGNKKDILLLKKIGEDGKSWIALSKKINPSKKYFLEGGIKILEIKKKDDGSFVFYFESPITDDYILKYGKIPLPAYIEKRRKKIEEKNSFYEDDLRYQTVFAKEPGSVAAPTAGFHFSEELLNLISSKGVKVVKILLHIGWGTFKMVREDPENFVMPGEYCRILPAAADIINETKKNGKRIFAVGTSTMRTIEKMKTRDGFVKAGETETDIFISIGHKFSVADAFITNFHVPDSPPLYMTAAFCGKELLFKAYKEAVKEKYRFYSYGDSCLII
ncbi:MAG: tRNA preQ1(34) S-adenosylmethionine ribosyltransferase-isomerase QueA [Elusimicrobiota bacterium]